MKFTLVAIAITGLAIALFGWAVVEAWLDWRAWRASGAHQPDVNPWADVPALSAETRVAADQLLTEALSPEARQLLDQIGRTK